MESISNACCGGCATFEFVLGLTSRRVQGVCGKGAFTSEVNQ